MPDETIELEIRANRIRKVMHVLIHGDHGKLAGIVVDLSRTGCLLTVRGEQWEVGDDEIDFSLISLRVATHFAEGMRIEFVEAGRTIEADAIRFTEAQVDDKKMICIGCRFPRELTSDMVAAIVHDPGAEPDAPPPGEPAKAKKRIVVHAPNAHSEDGIPLLPQGQANGAHDLLRLMVARGASDLHVRGGSVVRLRIDGGLIRVSGRAVTPDESATLVRELLTEEEFMRFENEWDLDLGYSAEGLGRFRINVLRANGEIGMVIRRIPEIVPSLDELGLAPVCKTIAEATNGLILVTGATGAGKTTTLAAMVRHINETRACHIVTLEDPIEYLHHDQVAQITQREIGRDVKGFNGALRRAMRQDPDVLLVGEMRDLETIALAVTAAETGHLVLGTLHTTSAATTVERIVDVFPAAQQAQIRLQLASTLKAICSQVLVPRIKGGQIVAQEILIATSGVRALIREGKVPQITNMMQTGGKSGMQTLEESLNSLVASGIVEPKAALARANDGARIHKPARKRRNPS